MHCRINQGWSPGSMAAGAAAKLKKCWLVGVSGVWTVAKPLIDLSVDRATAGAQRAHIDTKAHP